MISRDERIELAQFEPCLQGFSRGQRAFVFTSLSFAALGCPPAVDTSSNLILQV